MFASSEEVRELLFGLAVIFWGLLAVALLFACAVWQGAARGAALAILTAGSTYLFQELQRHASGPSKALITMNLLPLGLFAVSLVMTLKGV